MYYIYDYSTDEYVIYASDETVIYHGNDQDTIDVFAAYGIDFM